MAGVSISNVQKGYGAVQVLHGVDIDVADGEFLTLVGPSGCGKSTLLRMIAGLEEISGGTVSIGGRVVNDLAPKDRDIAMVFQNYALYPHMTVRESMAFSMKLKRADVAATAARVDEAAVILGLTPLLDRRPKELSGGQRQRVAMGRAIIRDPLVFLFDEPLSNLDAKLRVQMRAEIKALHQRLGTTVIYVTHDQVEAMTMADRIVVMRDGRIEQIGTPLDLFDFPVNRFVAGFIGSPSMNFLEGHVTGGEFALAGGTLTLPVPQATPDGPCTIGLRPEHIARTREGDGLVHVVEPMGSETQVIVKLAGAEVVCVARERLALRPGDRIGIAPAGKVHVFNPVTGMAQG